MVLGEGVGSVHILRSWSCSETQLETQLCWSWTVEKLEGHKCWTPMVGLLEDQVDSNYSMF